MKALEESVDSFITIQRSVGFKMRRERTALKRFVEFMRANGHEYIRTTVLLEYLRANKLLQVTTLCRLASMVRAFARHRSFEDPRTEVPASNILPIPKRAFKPYLYSESEIAAIMDKLASCRTWSSYSRLCRWALIGTIASTGMRLQEAISLSIDDVDLEQGVILVRNTKFKKNRYVVIHETVSSILGEFAKRRDEFFGGRRPRFFFPSRRGRRFSNSDLSEYFINALVDLGMRPRRGKGPRIHDFRHRFATATITELYRAGRDLESSLPILATYLGHGKIEHTYQYMALVPELKIEALRRLSISEQAQFYGASA